jgi:hypothetical protein
MQNAKDTFYVVLRDRLAALNPFVTNNDQPNSFCLRWTALRLDAEGELPLVTMSCEIRYATDGNPDNGGMDRGRMLAAMDAELAAAVNSSPQSATKMRYADSGPGTAPSEMGTNVFWGHVTFGAVTIDAERLQRVAMVEVFAYQEAGEL